jgi:DNA primase
MEIEGLDFVEALKLLAERAGVTLSPRVSTLQERGAQNTKDRKTLFFTLYALAQQYYARVLFDDAGGEPARAYVRSRHIGQHLAKTFLLGASTDAWDGLVRHLQGRGFLEADIIDSGLALQKKSGSGAIDRFRNRLMIPICDVQGRVIAFTARILPATVKEGIDPGGKYINSPETLLYKKGETLYGLHLAKTEIRKAGEVVLVEGNLDVIASHKAEVRHVVAASGTALTHAQLAILARFTKRVVLCLDDDAAGFAAAKRVFDLVWGEARSLGLEMRCIAIPEGLGKDPDDVVQKDPEAWKRLVVSSQDIIEYLFQRTVRTFSQDGVPRVDDRAKLIDALLPYLSRLDRPDTRYLYFSRLADMTHVPVDVLVAQAKMIKPQTGAAKPVVSAMPSKKATPETSLSSPEAFLFGLCLCFPEWTSRVLGAVEMEMLSAPWKTLYESLKFVYTQEDLQPQGERQKNQSLFSRLRTYLEQHAAQEHLQTYDAVAISVDGLLSALSPTDVAQEGEKHVSLLLRRRQDVLRRDLLSRIREAELQNNTEQVQQLMREYQQLLS